jgi:hypothetical protein
MNRLTDEQTNRQTDEQTNRQMDKQTDKQYTSEVEHFSATSIPRQKIQTHRAEHSQAP